MIALLSSEIGAIAAAVAALAGLVSLIWTAWLSPRAKARRKALEAGKQAVDDGDVSGITGFFDKIRK